MADAFAAVGTRLYLGTNQRLFLDEIVDRPGHWTCRDLAKLYGVSYESARQGLRSLQRRGYVMRERIPGESGYVWLPTLRGVAWRVVYYQTPTHNVSQGALHVLQS